MLVLVVPKILADEAVRLQFCSYLVVVEEDILCCCYCYYVSYTRATYTFLDEYQYCN